MAKKEYFDSAKTRWFFKGVGCIPVDRSIHDDNAKNKALDVLNKGLCFGIFPEGTRNRTQEKLLQRLWIQRWIKNPFIRRHEERIPM